MNGETMNKALTFSIWNASFLFSNKLFSLTAADKSSRSRKLKHDVIEAVNELIQDIATCHEQIAEQAVEHIHQKYFSP